MRVPFFDTVSIESLDSRYTVYLAEIQKRLIYVSISFLCALFCAYTERVSLLYSMTSCYKQGLPGEVFTLTNQKEWFLCFLIKIKDYLSFSNLGFSLPFQRVESSHLSDTDTIDRLTDTIDLLHVKDKAINCISMQVEKTESEFLQRPCSSFCQASLDVHSTLSGDAPISGDGAMRLIFTDVEEAFYTLLSVSLFWCLFVCLPVLLYHVLCFLQPGFYAWQSWRVCVSVFRRVILGYVVLQIVHLFFIPRLLAFFYSFQIERSSLYLHAETKVVSYVSLYVFVYCATVLFLLVTGVWSFYKERQILRSLHASRVFEKRSFALPVASTCSSSNLLCLPLKKSDNLRQEGCLKEQERFSRDRYKEHRGKIWWGCLLLAAFFSPPEISSQILCTSLLIVWSEISIWMAHILSARFLYQKDLSHLYF